MLGELVERLGGRCLAAVRGTEISGVQLDSRRVLPGDLFVALRGDACDGRDFIDQALAAGASAVLVQEEPIEAALGLGPEVPLWIHEDARAVAGHAASWVLERPSRALDVFAVTGTNGKTTTAHIMGELLRATGRKPAVLGTAGHRLAGDEHLRATHTTPDGPELQRLLARHRDRNGDCVVLEVSSHALIQERTAGLDIDYAVYTNLSRDHLDYHADMQQYAAAKSLMFSSLDSTAVAIINQDDGYASMMADAARRQGAAVVLYGGVLYGGVL
jgi:UDP-N-acetylmuramoyl-L-alanyl-D-glutamate--2,6-diaminopimelate ligase